MRVIRSRIFAEDFVVKKLLGFLLIIGMAMIQPAAAEQLNRVAAVVNGNVITMYDLERNS